MTKDYPINFVLLIIVRIILLWHGRGRHQPSEEVGGEWGLTIHLQRKKNKFQDLAISPTQLSITKSTAGKGLYLTQIVEPRLHRGRNAL
jgi:hypothetical protein